MNAETCADLKKTEFLEVIYRKRIKTYELVKRIYDKSTGYKVESLKSIEKNNSLENKNNMVTYHIKNIEKTNLLSKFIDYISFTDGKYKNYVDANKHEHTFIINADEGQFVFYIVTNNKICNEIDVNQNGIYVSFNGILL